MQTRSQTRLLKTVEKPPMYELDIDFDDASACWRKNKKYLGNGTYKYICPIQKKDGNICCNPCYGQLIVCWAHRRWL
jgi:hypothetical protein